MYVMNRDVPLWIYNLFLLFQTNDDTDEVKNMKFSYYTVLDCGIYLQLPLMENYTQRIIP